MYIGFGRYATAWEAQIGRLWFGLLYPRFWLFGRTPGYGRTWLYNWSVFIRWTEADDGE